MGLYLWGLNSPPKNENKESESIYGIPSKISQG